MLACEHLIFGVDLGGTSTRVRLYDPAVRLLASAAIPTGVSAGTLFSPAMFRAVREDSVVYRLGEPTQFSLCELGRIFICPASRGPSAALLGAGLLPRLAGLRLPIAADPLTLEMMP